MPTPPINKSAVRSAVVAPAPADTDPEPLIETAETPVEPTIDPADPRLAIPQPPAKPQPNVKALLNDIHQGHKLLTASVAGYSAITRLLSAEGEDMLPPLFEWQARQGTGEAVQVVSDLALLPAEQRPSVLGPLANLHAEQMARAAEQIRDAATLLATMIRQSQKESAA